MNQPLPELPIKFGDFFKYSQKLYQFVLINPYKCFTDPPENWTPSRRFFSHVFFWFTFGSSALVITLQTVYLFFLMSRTEDIAQIISSAAWIPVSLIAFEGLLFTWRHGQRITRLIGVLANTFPESKDAQDYASVRETYEKWHRMSGIVCRFYFLALYIIFFQNASLATLGYFRSGEWHLKMPRLLWYPFDVSDQAPISVQALVYLWECWGTMTTTRAVVTTGVFLGSLSMHICIQFDGLRRRFLELSPRGGKCRDSSEDTEQLIELVRQHNYLMGLCEELGEIYSVSLLVNYVLSSIVIGCFGFLILNEPVVNQKTEYIFDFLCFMSYNSLFSFYGDSLMDRAIFRSNWLDAELRYKKDLLFVMTRAGKPFVLSGYFFFASYETYTKILTTSYSYLALLLASYRKQR